MSTKDLLGFWEGKLKPVICLQYPFHVQDRGSSGLVSLGHYSGLSQLLLGQIYQV